MSKSSNLIVFIIPFLSISHQLIESISLTTDLIHRDHSPQSPSYDPSLTPFQRTITALKRSSNHRRRFTSPLTYSGGDYLMRFSLGSPPLPSLAIADTGSDVIWTQCQPCIQCFNQSLPIFAPKSSHTYRNTRCNTCNYVPQSYCRQKHCLYALQYGDQSYSYGVLAMDTFTFGTLSFPNIIFGCGFINGGVFSGIESGVVGLGGGKASLVRQLGGGKFSYFLSSTSGSSKLWVGSLAKVSGRGVVSAALVKKIPDTFYYLRLEGVRVGNDEFVTGGTDMIVDSGTALTFLPAGLYDEVERAVRRWVKLEEIEDPAGVLSLCYSNKMGKIIIPEVVFRFKGADVKLRNENVFVRTSDVAMCLAFKATDDVAIYGNLAQMNFLVGYDLRRRTVSFKPTD